MNRQWITRITDDRIGIQKLVLKYDCVSCEHCGFQYMSIETHYPEARRLCCNEGLALAAGEFPQLEPLPSQIAHIYRNYGPSISQKSFRYNNFFQISAISCDPSRSRGGQGWTGPGGGYDAYRSMTIHGRLYHAVRDATQQGPVRWLLHVGDDDENSSVQNNRATELELDPNLVNIIRTTLLNHNAYYRTLRHIGEEQQLARHRSPEDSAQYVGVRIAGACDRHEVAYIRTYGVRAGRGEWASSTDTSIVIWINGPTGYRTETVSATSALYEPLSYPLFFLCAEDGWKMKQRTDSGNLLSLQQYVRMRILLPEPELEDEAPALPNYYRLARDEESTARLTRFATQRNRFQILGRLMQVYIVDMWSRIVDQRLKWIRDHQARFSLHSDDARATTEQQENTIVELGEETGVVADDTLIDGTDGPSAQQDAEEFQQQKVFLPSSFTGGPRHRRRLCANALTLWQRLGKPTLFVTATANPQWDEITRELNPGQTAFDRPDVTCRVFHAKMSLLLKAIRSGKIFGTDFPVQYEMRVIEYQKRGLPHAHMVFKFRNVPLDNNVQLAEWIDRNICAEIPFVSGNNDETFLPGQANKDIRARLATHIPTNAEVDETNVSHWWQNYSAFNSLHEDDAKAAAFMASTKMLHRCRSGENGCINNNHQQTHNGPQAAQCKQHFPKTLTEHTQFDAKGYPNYRRRYTYAPIL